MCRTRNVSFTKRASPVSVHLHLLNEFAGPKRQHNVSEATNSRMHLLQSSPRMQMHTLGILLYHNKSNTFVQPAITLPKLITSPPTFHAFTNALLLHTNSLSRAKRKMLDDDRVRSFLQTARLTARRAFFNTQRAISIIPRKVQTARAAAQRLTTDAIRKTNIQVSDDYVHGALDLLTVATLLTLSAQAIRISTRRYATAADIPIRLIRHQRILHGSVIAVRDGDNLRIRHAPPLQRLLGWYAKPRGRGISGDTIHVRLAGVDAPECGKFGAPGQKFGPAARKWLKQFEGRRVMVRLHSSDQYKRVVGTVWAKSNVPFLGSFGFWRQNIGLELVKAGYATVYTGSGAVYGGMKHVYEKAEVVAKGRREGMWINGKVETPAQFKRSLRAGFAPKGGRTKGTTESSKKETGAKAMLKALAGFYEYLTKFR